MQKPAQSDPLAQRSFWPRISQPQAFADVDQDRPCGNCGYNLRGLPPRQPCPECGSVGGMNVSDEPIPFDERPGPIEFLATVAMLVGSPHDVARQVWRPVRMDVQAARRFRNINLIVAMLSIATVTFAITQHFRGPAVGAMVATVSLVASLVWLHGLSLALDSFIRRGNAPKTLEPRARAVALYASGTFWLAPVQLIALLATSRVMPMLPAPLNWVLPAAAHYALLILLMLPGIIASAWIVYELVDVSPARAFGMTLVAMIGRLIIGAIMLILIPAMACVLATNLFSR